MNKIITIISTILMFLGTIISIYYIYKVSLLVWIGIILLLLGDIIILMNNFVQDYMEEKNDKNRK